MHVGVVEGCPSGQCFQMEMKAAFSLSQTPFVIKGPAGDSWALPPWRSSVGVARTVGCGRLGLAPT